MRTIKAFLVIFLLVVGSSVYAQDHGHRNNGNHGHRNNGNHGGQAGAPLDGGLLTVLGAGGIAYYVARKKRKKLES